MPETTEALVTKFPRAQLPGETRKQYHRRYIQSDCWQEIKDGYFNDWHNPFRCVVCGADQVDLHHLSYRRLGGDETHQDLAPLCRADHELVHRLESTMRACGADPELALQEATRFAQTDLACDVDVQDVVDVLDRALEHLGADCADQAKLLRIASSVSVYGTWGAELQIEFHLADPSVSQPRRFRISDSSTVRAFQSLLGHGNVCVFISVAKSVPDA